ncbi:putative serine protease pcp-1 [Ditylenchus destructor]|nr:putative serine protease pcp-1 [Ditylenchus destructor]
MRHNAQPDPDIVQRRVIAHFVPLEKDCERLFMFILDAFLGLVDRNLPYPTDFDGLKVPAWPIKEACQSIATEEPALQLYKFISAYYNPNNTFGNLCIYPEKCPERRYSSTNRVAKIYQMCSELPIYLGAGFTVDFVNGSVGQLAQSFVGNLSFMSWPPYYYDTDLIEEFLEDYDPDTHLQNHFVDQIFGFDYATNGSTNIIFTIPELAPWSSGAISRDNPHNGIFSFSISAAAPKHDLYQPNTCDPLSVVSTRFQAVQILKCWTGQPPDPGVDCTDLQNSLLRPLPIVEMEDLMRQNSSECSYVHKVQKMAGPNTKTGRARSVPEFTDPDCAEFPCPSLNGPEHGPGENQSRLTATYP